MILVVNAGSSSVKIEIFDERLTSLLSGAVSEIGGAARITVGDDVRETDAADHKAALSRLFAAIDTHGFPAGRLSAAGHRVVHGGASLTQPARLTRDVIEQITACNTLAPLHNPNNLAAIHALAEMAPDLPQFASFDTAFHVTNPDLATTYAIPAAERAKGIRRYGFHGLSYAGIVDALKPDLPDRVLALHLGNGASLCAIREGRSIATSMGYSPADGMVMGTRPGDIDSMAVLRMAEDHGIDGAMRLINRECGLAALGGSSDMASLLARDDEDARFAVDHFCYWAVRHSGALIAALGGCDAIVFTGGIGENAAPVRDRIMGGLAWTGLQPDATANAAGGPRLHATGSAVSARIVPADEERVIARDVLSLLQSTGA